MYTIISRQKPKGASLNKIMIIYLSVLNFFSSDMFSFYNN